MKEELCVGISAEGAWNKVKDPLVVEEEYQELKRNFPKSEPYVL